MHIKKGFMVGGSAVALTMSCMTAAPAFSADSPTPSNSTSVNYAVQSDSPLPATLSQSAAESGSPNGSGSVRYDVPSGYTRHGNKTDTHLYRSDNGYYGDYHCTDRNCRLSSEVAVVFNEYAYGGSSKRWSLYITERTLVSSALKHSYTYQYFCAQNIKGKSDKYCESKASPNESGGVQPLPSQRNIQNKGLNRAFEDRPGAVNYPMYGLTIHWSDGVNQTARFRGWDVCVQRTTTALCPESGDGS